MGLGLGLENKERSKDNQKHYLAIDDKLGHHFMWYIDCCSWMQVYSLERGSIAERSGIRVGHRIIEINGTSTVGLGHDEIVYLLSTTVGDVS